MHFHAKGQSEGAQVAHVAYIITVRDCSGFRTSESSLRRNIIVLLLQIDSFLRVLEIIMKLGRKEVGVNSNHRESELSGGWNPIYSRN